MDPIALADNPSPHCPYPQSQPLGPQDAVAFGAIKILSGTATWNSGGTTFQGILANVTNTASASGSTLLDLQQDGVSCFNVQTISGTVANGTVAKPATTGNAPSISSAGSDTNVGLLVSSKGTGSLSFQIGGTTKASVNSNGSIVASNGRQEAVNSQSSNYTALSTDYLILGTGGTLGITITLPLAGSNSGQVLCIIKADSGVGGVTVATSGSDKLQTVGGVNLTSLALSAQNNSIVLISDGSANWYAMSKL